MNRLNDGTYYVNINFNVCLHNNNLFHIYINEHVHMLGKKTGVLFTISSGNFELKQGKEYRSPQHLRILRLHRPPARPPARPPIRPSAHPPIKSKLRSYNHVTLPEVKMKITPVYSAKIIIISVASNLSFFTFNTKNSTTILHINIIYQPVEYSIIIYIFFAIL